MRRLLILISTFTAFGVGQVAYAQQDDVLGAVRVYAGLGTGDAATATTSGATPWVVGATLGIGEGTFVGLDVAGEGTKLDSTGGRNEEPVQSVSFNAVLGTSLVNGAAGQPPLVEAGLLIGIRETAVSCPPSNIGFDCYADLDPETSSTINAGALLMMNFNNATLGFRATGESQQIIFGIQF